MVTFDIFGEAIETLSTQEWFSLCSEKKRSDLIERFCALARECSPEECSLLFQLTKKFENLPLAKYENALESLVSSLPEELFRNIERIFVIPVSAKKDSGKLKSGSMIGHLLKTYLGYDAQIDDDVEIHFLPNVSYLKNKMKRGPSLIIFCDDFIGTGSQASGCINWYSDFKKNEDTAIFATISILQSGLEHISRLGYAVYHQSIYKKAISDFQNEFSTNAISIMEDIETRIKVPSRYRLGFEGSEALLAFNLRAPNNTFPVYWYKHKGSRRKPVFER